jgi:hypothetical protein
LFFKGLFIFGGYFFGGVTINTPDRYGFLQRVSLEQMDKGG